MPISFNLFYDAWRPHGCYNMPTPLEKTTKHRPIMGEIFSSLHMEQSQIQKMSERQTKAGNQITLSHSLILSLSHSFTLSFTHSQHAEQLLFSCLCSKITLSLSHSHTLALSHSRTLALSHSHTLTLSHSLILSFTLSRHAEQLLFSCLCSKVTV